VLAQPPFLLSQESTGVQAKNYSLAPAFNAGTGAVTTVQSAQNRTSTIY